LELDKASPIINANVLLPISPVVMSLISHGDPFLSLLMGAGFVANNDDTLGCSHVDVSPTLLLKDSEIDQQTQ